MKKLLTCLILSVFLLSLALGSALSCSSTETPSEPVVLKLSTTLPPAQEAYLEEMAERFNQRAVGTNYSIEVFPDGVLCTMEESFDMVRTGGVDMSEIGLSSAVAQDGRFGAMGLPFTIDDIEASIKYVEIINEKLFGDIMEEKFNQKIVASWLSPPLDYCGMKPVKTLEDWDGLLVHTMTPVQTQTVEALGGSAVSMPFFDVIPSLEKGVIDGGVNLNAYVISMFNWYDAFKYATVATMFSGYLCLNINLDAFNAMPDEVQDILLEEGEWLVQTMTAAILDKNEESAALCTENGIEVYFLPEAERALWADATSSIIDDFFATLDPDDVDTIQDAIAEANE